MPVSAAAAMPPASAPNFRKYSGVYDLLYRDKDYAAEADYVAQILRGAAPDARDILELGSGTGRHGCLLAQKGFHVHGIERSADMVALAKSAAAETALAGRFDCQVGDVRSVDLGRRFDAVTALFHVVSYQTSDADLAATFAAAARHLSPGAPFVFDVWHGPAVEAQPPEQRVKKAADSSIEVTRTARPQLDAARRTVNVKYDIACRDKRSGKVARFSEDHLMRYLFPAEIEAFAAASGFTVAGSEEFMTKQAPSPATWSVLYVLRKVATP